MKTIALLPTYNERENLQKMVAAILAQNLGLDILVIDDNSPDGTGQIAERLSSCCIEVIPMGERAMVRDCAAKILPITRMQLWR